MLNVFFNAIMYSPSIKLLFASAIVFLHCWDLSIPLTFSESVVDKFETWPKLKQIDKIYPGVGDSVEKTRAYRFSHVVTVRPPFAANKNSDSQPFIRIPAEENACGISRVKPLQQTAYVIGGQRANTEEFPWFGAITKYQHNAKPNWRVVCGSSLLTPKFAITAAHCLHQRYKDTLEVVFNLKDTSNISHTAAPWEIRRKIARFVIHPKYNSRTQDNDIALIQFKEPINFRREKILSPICLPEKSGNTFANKNGIFTGFGHTSYGSGSSKENSRYLMKVNVPILSHSDCLKSKVPTKKNITEEMVCAGDTGKDSCINDSGGPLMVIESPGKAVLVGISSWGIGCALSDYPGVYTRVTKYLSWIRTASST